MIFNRQLNIKITDYCNAACSFCGYNKTEFKQKINNGYQPFVLDVEEFIQKFPHLKKKGIRKLHITGGEPFMHPMLMEFIQAAKADGFSVQTGTNGSLLTEEVVLALKKAKIDYLWLSLDTFPLERHLEHRGLTEHELKFRNGISLLKKYKINFFGQTVISHIIPKKNGLPDLEGHLEYYFNTFGIHRFIFSYPMYRPEIELKNKHLATNGSEAVAFNPNELAQIYKLILQIKRKNRTVQIINPFISLQQQLNEISQQPDGFDCYAGRDIFFLGSDQNSLRPCYYYADVVLDEITTTGLKNVTRYASCRNCQDECFRDASIIYHVKHRPADLIWKMVYNSELRRFIFSDIWNVIKSRKYQNA